MAAVSMVGVLSGCSHKASPAAAIEKVIQTDIALAHSAEQRMGLLDKYWDRSVIVGQYAKQIAAIDLSDCPADFQQAYLAHAQAWASWHRQLANNSGVNGFIKGVLLPSQLGDVVLEGENEQKQVQTTWFAVERIAQRYGINIAALEQRNQATAVIPNH